MTKLETIEKIIKQLAPFLSQAPICLDVNRLMSHIKRNIEMETQISYEESVGGKSSPSHKPFEINVDAISNAIKLAKEAKSLFLGGK